ncbi:hypothetical protein D3C85_1485330 [compost metagenome]
MDRTDEADMPRVVHHRDRLIGIGQEVLKDGVRKRHRAEEIEQRRPGGRAAQQEGLLAGIEQGQPDVALAIDLELEDAAGAMVLGRGQRGHGGSRGLGDGRMACRARAGKGLPAGPEHQRAQALCLH